jgi:hypothetical protein
MQGLNPLGFDLGFVPLLSPADAYTLAADPTGQAVNLETAAYRSFFDYNQDLTTQIAELRSVREGLIGELASLCGITIARATTLTAEQVGDAGAQECGPDNPSSILRVKAELSTAGLASVRAAQQRLGQVSERLAISLDRDVMLEDEAWETGTQLGALDYQQALLQSISVSHGVSATFGVSSSQGVNFSFGISSSVSYNPHRQELARIARARDMVQAASRVRIIQIERQAAVRNSMLEQANEALNLEVEIAKSNAATAEANNVASRVQTIIALRDQALRDIETAHPTRDVLRLQTNRTCLDATDAFDEAVRRVFVYVRAVEYEGIIRLDGEYNPNRLFTFRRAAELQRYLTRLREYYVSLHLDADLNRFTYPVSLARDLLNFHSGALRCQGPNCQNCQGEFFDSTIRCAGDDYLNCQPRVFAEYIRRHTFETSVEGQYRTVIEFGTPMGADRSYQCLPDVIDSDRIAGSKLTAAGQPLPQSTGLRVTFHVQGGVRLNTVEMVLKQDGHSIFRDRCGRTVEYKPRHPLVFLGLPQLPEGIRADSVEGVINACNDDLSVSECPNFYNYFLRRSLYNSSWSLEILTGNGSHNPSLDLSRLTDVKFHFDIAGFTTISCP